MKQSTPSSRNWAAADKTVKEKKTYGRHNARMGKDIYMAKKAVINFRVEENLKVEMERACRGMGINMTMALDLFCRKVVAERKIPFEIGTGTGTGGRQGFSSLQ